MKNIITIVTLIFMSSLLVNSQNNNITDDERARIGLYIDLNSDIYNVRVSSNTGKSVADIITKSFESNKIVPDISIINSVEGAERTELIGLIDRLNYLLANPPSWDKLLQQQKEINSKPPTPPVNIKDLPPIDFYNSKYANKNRHFSGKDSKYIETETSREPAVTHPPKTSVEPTKQTLEQIKKEETQKR